MFFSTAPNVLFSGTIDSDSNFKREFSSFDLSSFLNVTGEHPARPLSNAVSACFLADALKQSTLYGNE